MSQTTTLNELRRHLNDAKDRLSAEKQAILQLHPLAAGFRREQYAFTYVRAERLGMRSINRRLSDISWLPMQIDARAEIMGDHRASMKRWLTCGLIGVPDAEAFGNDFIHALTRCGVAHGWENGETLRLSARIANLFRDLSCLIGLAYYCGWLDEHGVTHLPLSAPGDLPQMAIDIAALLQTAQLSSQLRAHEQDDEKALLNKAAAREPKSKKPRPDLRVIHNGAYTDPFMPDPVTV